jgi:hypothetical protein
MIVGCINICQQTMTTVYFSSMTFHFIPIFLVRYQRFLMLHPCNIHNIKKWLSRSVLIGLSIHFHFIHQKMTDFPTQDASLGQKKTKACSAPPKKCDVCRLTWRAFRRRDRGPVRMRDDPAVWIIRPKRRNWGTYEQYKLWQSWSCENIMKFRDFINWESGINTVDKPWLVDSIDHHTNIPSIVDKWWLGDDYI